MDVSGENERRGPFSDEPSTGRWNRPTSEARERERERERDDFWRPMAPIPPYCDCASPSVSWVLFNTHPERGVNPQKSPVPTRYPPGHLRSPPVTSGPPGRSVESADLQHHGAQGFPVPWVEVEVAWKRLWSRGEVFSVKPVVES